MVEKQHYRWDFVGLSTDTKPTPETSEKVVDGSTYYESDTSKLYVFCETEWYERKPLGGGGGGSDINVVQTTGESTTDVMSQKAVTDALAEAGGPTVVQTTGESNTDVMSQNATTGMVFNDPANKQRIQIGSQSLSNATYSTAIGTDAQASANYSIALGYGTRVRTNNSGAIAIGRNAQTAEANTIALGSNSNAQSAGEMNIGVPNALGTGYNGSDYRLLTGLHDPVNAHDAATKGYVDSQGGGPTVVQSTGTSTTDVMSQYATTRIVAPNNTQSAIWLNNPIGVTSYPASIPDYSVTIQPHNNVQAGATAVSSIAISGATSGHSSIAIGVNSSATQKGSIALGRGASATSVGEMNIGTNDTTAGYNSTNYRLLSGVHDPVNAHDGATKGYVDNIVVNYAGLYNAGAPTTSTVAYYLGQFYYDTTNDDIYYCSNIDTTDPNNPVYTWTALPSGGGGPTVVQTTGTSTTDVMSQNAVTSMVFNDPANKLRIQIGNGAVSSPYADFPVAIGAQSRAQGSGSIALGVGSFASSRGELNIGTPYLSGYGYNGTDYRLITGVHDGQSAQDAVTVNQVNSVIDAINTALSTNIPHIGATS